MLNFLINIATFTISLLTFTFYLMDRAKANKKVKYKIESILLITVLPDKTKCFSLNCTIYVKNRTSKIISINSVSLLTKNSRLNKHQTIDLPQKILPHSNTCFCVSFLLQEKLIHPYKICISDTATEKPFKIKLRIKK